MNILIAGATSAIAQATARSLVGDGARFFLVGRNGDKLEAVAADLKARGAADVHTYVLNLNDLQGQEAMLARARECLGALDAALIAHGTLPVQKEVERSAERTVEAFQTNAMSTIALLTRLGDLFERQGRGTIVAISSVAGERGRASNYVYGASKAAVTAFASGLRNRLAAKGVRVVTIKPGFVRTPMTAGMPDSPLFASPEKVASAIRKVLLGSGGDVVYTPGYWRLVMAGIRAVPERLFKRLSL